MPPIGFIEVAKIFAVSISPMNSSEASTLLLVEVLAEVFAFTTLKLGMVKKLLYFEKSIFMKG